MYEFLEFVEEIDSLYRIHYITYLTAPLSPKGIIQTVAAVLRLRAYIKYCIRNQEQPIQKNMVLVRVSPGQDFPTQANLGT